MLLTNVLVVEDELIIAKGLERRLKPMGYTVAGIASSGEEGLQRASEIRPDVILMDINLGGGIDGVEAADRVKQKLDIPVVFLTAYSDDATLQRAKQTEPHGYVLKPFEDRDLHTAIEIAIYRHAMLGKLRENERWLAATLGSIGDGVIAINTIGQVRFMNRVAEQLTGWSQVDARHQDVRLVFQVINSTTRLPVRNPALRAIENGQIVKLEENSLLIDRNGEERSIDDSAAPIVDTFGRQAGAVLVFRDVTERCRLEENLRQAQKLKAIGRLAGGIAHDFNNLLTVINGYGELLLQSNVTAEDRDEYIKHIVEAGQHAAALTQQIAAFSRKQILVPRIVNLNTILTEIGAMIRRLIGEDIEIQMALAPELGNIEADPSQVEQVVLNLATNARDAMPHGGQLSFETSSVALDNAAVQLHPDWKTGRYVKLTVKDTGCGISDAILTRIFDPFFTTKKIGKGTGLGLATVYGIVKQSGGHIEVTSRMAEGTAFSLYFPVIDAPITPPVESDDSIVSHRGHETILLVEDERAVARLIKAVLTHQGYTVLEAETGEDAVKCAERTPIIDLLITDMVLPRMSGREVADRLLRIKPNVRILYTTGYTEDVLIRQGISSAKVEFLQKPFEFSDLTAKVRRLIDSKNSSIG